MAAFTIRTVVSILSSKTSVRSASALVALLVVVACTAPPAAVPEGRPALLGSFHGDPPVSRGAVIRLAWDSAEPDGDARRQIERAWLGRESLIAFLVDVAGHADRSGPPGYNQRLSRRRAEAVTAELVRLGVDGDAIMITPYGEDRPSVPTPDGLREGRNRRAEVVFR